MHPPRNAVLCLLLLSISGCSNNGGAPPVTNGDPIKVGGLYATKDEDGSWRITKVLAVDDLAVHLRMYANKFPECPRDVDPAQLNLGGLDKPGGFGIGHFPLAKEGFFNDKPVLLKVVPVVESELSGYKLYLEAMKEGGR